jgi:hypothetical protein
LHTGQGVNPAVGQPSRQGGGMVVSRPKAAFRIGTQAGVTARDECPEILYSSGFDCNGAVNGV